MSGRRIGLTPASFFGFLRYEDKRLWSEDRQYKTAKDYGEQVVDVKEKAPEFNAILSKWVKSNPTDYLLFSSNQQKLTSPQVTRMLNKLFGKNTSTDLLRHIYLTNKYGKLQAEMAEDAKDMSHSSSTQALYIKK